VDRTWNFEPKELSFSTLSTGGLARKGEEGHWVELENIFHAGEIEKSCVSAADRSREVRAGARRKILKWQGSKGTPANGWGSGEAS